MKKKEFIYFYENFDFSQYPDSYQQFIKKEVIVIKRYIERKRKDGDDRSENDILIEWIENKNFNLLRAAWILEYCKGERLNDNEYNIPTNFCIKIH